MSTFLSLNYIFMSSLLVLFPLHSAPNNRMWIVFYLSFICWELDWKKERKRGRKEGGRDSSWDLQVAQGWLWASHFQTSTSCSDLSIPFLQTGCLSHVVPRWRSGKATPSHVQNNEPNAPLYSCFWCIFYPEFHIPTSYPTVFQEF